MKKHNTSQDCGCSGKPPSFTLKGSVFFVVDNIFPGMMEIRPANKTDVAVRSAMMKTNEAIVDMVSFIGWSEPEKGFVQMCFMLPMDEPNISWDMMVNFISDYLNVANGGKSELGGFDKFTLS